MKECLIASDSYEEPKSAEEKVRDSEGGSLDDGLAMQTSMNNEWEHNWHKQQQGTTRGNSDA